MKSFTMKGAIAALSTLAWAGPGLADIQDYEFQLVDRELKKGDGAIVSVRLVDKRSGKPVPGAIIVTKRIDMAPDGMSTMTGALDQLPSTEAGVYRFKTNLSMAGSWQLSLGAKVQGEAGTLQARLVFKAVQ